MTRIGIFNCKGGVGKTTSTLNLAAAAARAGHDVTMVDCDPQCHLTHILDAIPKNSKDSVFALFAYSTPLSELLVKWPKIGWLIPAHRQLLKVDSSFSKGPKTLRRLKDSLDTLDQNTSRTTLIDCSPHMGVLSLNAIFAADTILIPVSADYLSFRAAQQIEKALNALEPVLKRRPKRCYFMTRTDKRRNLNSLIHDKMKEFFGDELCQSTICENSALAESPMYATDIFSYKASSSGAKDYEALFQELKSKNVFFEPTVQHTGSVLKNTNNPATAASLLQKI